MQDAPARYSIVVPAYNSGEHLPECIDSILGQTIGEDRVQAVLVDDGSTDSTPAICREYAHAHPGSVAFARQRNAGVSAARNRGIALADGDYIGFVDSDDYLSPSALERVDALYRSCRQDLRVVTVPVLNVGGRRGPHYANGKFGGGTRVIDLSRPRPHDAYTGVGLAVFPARVARGLRFDESITYYEDAKFATEALGGTMRLGVAAGCAYYYRRAAPGAGSGLTARAASARGFYLDSPRAVELGMLEAHARGGSPPALYYQYLALAEMRWRTFYAPAPAEGALSAGELEECRELARRTLALVSDEAILSFDLCGPWQRAYLLGLKHGGGVLGGAAYGADGVLRWRGRALFDAARDACVMLAGYGASGGSLRVVGACAGDVPSGMGLRASLGGAEAEPSYLPGAVGALSRPVARPELAPSWPLFEVELPLPRGDAELSFLMRPPGAGRAIPVPRLAPLPGPAGDAARPAGKLAGGRILLREGGRIAVRRATPPRLARAAARKAARRLGRGRRDGIQWDPADR